MCLHLTFLALVWKLFFSAFSGLACSPQTWPVLHCLATCQMFVNSLASDPFLVFLHVCGVNSYGCTEGMSTTSAHWVERRLQKGSFLWLPSVCCWEVWLLLSMYLNHRWCFLLSCPVSQSNIVICHFLVSALLLGLLFLFLKFVFDSTTILHCSPILNFSHVL